MTTIWPDFSLFARKQPGGYTSQTKASSVLVMRTKREFAQATVDDVDKNVMLIDRGGVKTSIDGKEAAGMLLSWHFRNNPIEVIEVPLVSQGSVTVLVNHAQS